MSLLCVSYRKPDPRDAPALLLLAHLPACQLPAPQLRVVVLAEGGYAGLHAQLELPLEDRTLLHPPGQETSHPQSQLRLALCGAAHSSGASPDSRFIRHLLHPLHLQLEDSDLHPEREDPPGQGQDPGAVLRLWEGLGRLQRGGQTALRVYVCIPRNAGSTRELPTAGGAGSMHC